MRWLWLLAGLLLAAPKVAAASAAATAEADAIRLTRIKVHMSEILTRIPDYTCQLTVERTARLAKTRRFRLIDLLRLEVALVQGRELFSWPGEGKFDDREIGKIVGGGTIGNGNFALHARAVFLGGGVDFKYEGTREEKGRTLVRYTYRVPRAKSGYTLKSGALQGVTGYHGFFEVDQNSIDLVRLEVEAEDIPAHLPIQAARDLMEYARVKIGEHEFLLPKYAELSLTDEAGAEHRNRTTFAACRQYSGESVISFADPTPEPANGVAGAEAPAANVAVELPSGLGLLISLEDTLRFDKAAVGDPVVARIVENARWKGKTMVPRGAILRGRVMGFNRYYARSEIVRADVQFTSLEFPGAHAEIAGALEDVSTLPGWTRAAVDKQGIIYISGTRLELPRGLRMLWRLRSNTGSSSGPETGPDARKDMQ
ncbi:MAG: hypothetical protein IT168_06955 [Bryobacterales bacterium]|nr:hypothetical protein [Bryobacterales bacterium]